MTGSMRVYLRFYPIPVPLIVVVGAWHIIFVRALPIMFIAVVGWVLGVEFIFVDISSTSAQPTFRELLGERRVGGEIYCAVRGYGCVGD